MSSNPESSSSELSKSYLTRLLCASASNGISLIDTINCAISCVEPRSRCGFVISITCSSPFSSCLGSSLAVAAIRLRIWVLTLAGILRAVSHCLADSALVRRTSAESGKGGSQPATSLTATTVASRVSLAPPICERADSERSRGHGNSARCGANGGVISFTRSNCPQKPPPERGAAILPSDN